MHPWDSNRSPEGCASGTEQILTFSNNFFAAPGITFDAPDFCWQVPCWPCCPSLVRFRTGPSRSIDPAQTPQNTLKLLIGAVTFVIEIVHIMFLRFLKVFLPFRTHVYRENTCFPMKKKWKNYEGQKKAKRLMWQLSGHTCNRSRACDSPKIFTRL